MTPQSCKLKFILKLKIFLFPKTICGKEMDRRHDIQHNDTQHNDTQYKGLICDTQHKRHSIKQCSAIMLCHNAECRVLFNIMLNVVVLNVAIISVVMVNVIILNVVMLSVVAPMGKGRDKEKIIQ